MDDIWGYAPDEVRPFPARVVSADRARRRRLAVAPPRRSTSRSHAANGLLVLAIALRAAALSVPAATLAGLVFVPAARARRERWRGSPGGSIRCRRSSTWRRFSPTSAFARRAAARRYYPGRSRCSSWRSSPSRTTITMVATLVGYDLLSAVAVRARGVVAFVRTYLPYVLDDRRVPVAALRALRTGGREGALNARASNTSGPAARASQPRRRWRRRRAAVVVWLFLAGVIVVWLASAAIVRRWIPLPRRGLTRRYRARRRLGARLFVLRARVVGNWRAADRRGRLRLAAARLPGCGRLGGRAGHRVRGGVACSARSQVAARGCRRRGPRSCCSTSFRCTSVREWRTIAAVSHQVVRTCAARRSRRPRAA